MTRPGCKPRDTKDCSSSGSGERAAHLCLPHDPQEPPGGMLVLAAGLQDHGRVNLCSLSPSVC